MEQRDVADEEHDGTVGGRGDAEARSRRSRRFHWRRGWRARAAAARGRGRTSRRRAPASRRRPPASRPAAAPIPSSAATRGSLRPAGPSARAMAAAAARSARVPALEPGAVAAAATSSASRAARGSAGRRSATAPPGSCQAFSGSKRHLQRLVRARQPGRSGLEVGRSPTRSDELAARAAAAHRGRAGARRSGRSPPGRGGRRTAGRPAAGCPRGRRTRRARRRARGRARRGRRRSRRAGAPRARRAARRRAPAAGRRRRAGASPTGAPPAPAAAWLVVGQRPVGHERLAQREVQVHRAGPAADARSRTARHASWRSQRSRSGVAGCVVDLEVPLGGAAVELDLVDRLPGAERRAARAGGRR